VVHPGKGQVSQSYAPFTVRAPSTAGQNVKKFQPVAPNNASSAKIGGKGGVVPAPRVNPLAMANGQGVTRVGGAPVVPAPVGKKPVIAARPPSAGVRAQIQASKTGLPSSALFNRNNKFGLPPNQVPAKKPAAGAPAAAQKTAGAATQPPRATPTVGGKVKLSLNTRFARASNGVILNANKPASKPNFGAHKPALSNKPKVGASTKPATTVNSGALFATKTSLNNGSRLNQGANIGAGGKPAAVGAAAGVASAATKNAGMSKKESLVAAAKAGAAAKLGKGYIKNPVALGKSAGIKPSPLHATTHGKMIPLQTMTHGKMIPLQTMTRGKMNPLQTMTPGKMNPLQTMTHGKKIGLQTMTHGKKVPLHHVEKKANTAPAMSNKNVLQKACNSLRKACLGKSDNAKLERLFNEVKKERKRLAESEGASSANPAKRLKIGDVQEKRRFPDPIPGKAGSWAEKTAPTKAVSSAGMPAKFPVGNPTQRLQGKGGGMKGTQAQATQKNAAPATERSAQDVLNHKNIDPREREKRRAEVLQLCIQKLRSMPGKSMDINMLANDEDIRNKKKGAIAKFLEWIQAHPEVFQIRTNMVGKGHEIVLVQK